MFRFRGENVDILYSVKLFFIIFIRNMSCDFVKKWDQLLAYAYHFNNKNNKAQINK